MLGTIYLLLTLNIGVKSVDWSSTNIPEEHISYFLKNNPSIKKLCKDQNCPYKAYLYKRKCWGYEENCLKKEQMSVPSCPEDSRGWAQSKQDQVDHFWKGGDFGYIKERRNELTIMCQPENEGDSSLICAKYARYCRATHIYFDFRALQFQGSRDRYKQDVFKTGQVGGHCKFYSSRLKAQHEHKSALQSWYAELEQYTSLSFKPSEDSVDCDIYIDKPTYLIKLDAGVNMYHHFCDFVNLYASQHLINNSFSQDVNIVMWDTSEMGYGDFFHDTWKAFTNHSIIPLKQFEGKRVCFKEAVFSLLARMRYGMYYNMPLIPGCYGSSLFRAFSQHILHRLGKTQEGPLENQIRITLLSRRTTYRNILNEKQLINAMKTVGEYDVRLVVYNKDIPFLDQLQISANSDIFIGMHGAGLTHLMFLPDWAVAIELYNCEDAGCYYDLARLRGVKYMTWQRKDKLTQQDEGHHPTLGAHAKFTNYAFDVQEFMRLIDQAADHVRLHKTFIEARKVKYIQHIQIKDEL